MNNNTSSKLLVILAVLFVVSIPFFVRAVSDDPGPRSGPNHQILRVQSGLNKPMLPTSKSPNFIDGQVLVKFKPERINVSQSSNSLALTFWYSQKLVREEARLKQQNVVLLKSGSKTTEELIASLTNDPLVEYAEPNYIYTATATTPNDTSFSNLWGLNNTGQTVNGTAGTSDADIDAPEAWDTNTGTNSVTVAVIDTGVTLLHPDLAASLIAGYDFVDDDAIPYDLNEHGTHVSGTIGAIGNNATGVTGVAWNPKIMPLRVLNASGSGSTVDIVAAVIYATQNGANIINMSLGGTGYSQTYYDAINTARSAGVLVVVAAGNSTNNNDGGTHFYPCDYTLDNIICVAATDQNDALASFSNYGATSVDLAAPGVNIYSTIPYWAFSEDFDSAIPLSFTGTKFTSSGTNNYWTTIGDGIAYGDIDYYSYKNNSNGVLTFTDPVDTSSYDAVYLQYEYLIESEYDAACAKDYLLVEVYNGSGWTEVKRYCGTGTSGTETLDVSSYKNASMKVRFQWVTNASESFYYGVAIDNVKLIPPNAAAGSYAFLQGTSMASPQVAGLAALLKSYQPSLTYLDLRSAILDHVEAKGSLTGKTVTGGRINAYHSISNLDLVNPTATVTYSTTVLTNQNVTATLVPSEAITVTNNSGSPSYTFTSNGSFTFTFTDLAGNPGTATATVGNIDKTAPVITLNGAATMSIKPKQTYIDLGAVTIDDLDGNITGATVVTNNLNTGIVGEYYYRYTATDRAGNIATADRTVIVAAQSTYIALTRGAYTATFNGKKRTISPLGTYTGRALARKMIVKNYNRPIYVFVPLEAQASPNIVVVDYKGNVIRRTSLKTLSTKGLNADTVADGINVFLAVGPISASSTARVYRLTATTTPLVNSLSQSTKGNVFVKFLKLFSPTGNQYGLAAAIKGKTNSIRVWRYNSVTKKYARLTTYNVKRIILSSTGLSLRSGTALVP